MQRDLHSVLESPDIPRREKLRLLVERTLDERALLVADDEGMQGGRAPRLRDVLQARRELRHRELGNRERRQG